MEVVDPVVDDAAVARRRHHDRTCARHVPSATLHEAVLHRDERGGVRHVRPERIRVGTRYLQLVGESLHGANAAVHAHAHGPAAEVAERAVDHGVRHAALAEPDPVRAARLLPSATVEHDIPHAVRKNHPARHCAEHERVGTLGGKP